MLSWENGTARDSPNRQIRSLVLCVDLVGSRWIWPAHVGWVVDLVGSRPVPSDRLDDQTDDQAGQPVRTSITHDSFRGVVSSLRLQLALAGRPLRAGIGCGACPTCSSTDSPPSQASASG